jgi:hypothetical protein
MVWCHDSFKDFSWCHLKIPPLFWNLKLMCCQKWVMVDSVSQHWLIPYPVLCSSKFLLSCNLPSLTYKHMWTSFHISTQSSPCCSQWSLAIVQLCYNVFNHALWLLDIWVLFRIFFFVELEFELRALHLQSRCSTIWATPPVHFVLVILEMGGSHELFPLAVLELQASWF